MTEPTWQSSTPTQATRLPMDPVPPEPMTGITWFWWLIRPNPLFGSMEAQLKVWNMRMEREPVERFSRMLKTWTSWQLAGIRQAKVMPPMVSTAGWMTSTFTIELSPKRKSPFFTRCEEVGSKFQDWRLSSIPLAPSTVDSGLGYKETPEVVFSYGSDANTTAQLAVYNAADTPAHGTLAYEENSSLVYVYHDAPHSRGAPAWRVFEQAYGLAELNATSVEHILWTKDTGTNHILTLPNDRNVTRRYAEYVAPGIGALGSPDSNFSAYSGPFRLPVSLLNSILNWRLPVIHMHPGSRSFILTKTNPLKSSTVGWV